MRRSLRINVCKDKHILIFMHDIRGNLFCCNLAEQAIRRHCLHSTFKVWALVQDDYHAKGGKSGVYFLRTCHHQRRFESWQMNLLFHVLRQLGNVRSFISGDIAGSAASYDFLAGLTKFLGVADIEKMEAPGNQYLSYPLLLFFNGKRLDGE